MHERRRRRLEKNNHRVHPDQVHSLDPGTYLPSSLYPLPPAGSLLSGVKKISLTVRQTVKSHVVPTASVSHDDVPERGS